MIEASILQQTGNRAEVAKLITDRSFTGAKPKNKALQSKFTRPGIVGDYDYGGFDDKSALPNP